MAKLPRKRNTGKAVHVAVTRRKPKIPPGLAKKLRRTYAKEKGKPGQKMDFKA